MFYYDFVTVYAAFGAKLKGQSERVALQASATQHPAWYPGCVGQGDGQQSTVYPAKTFASIKRIFID